MTATSPHHRLRETARRLAMGSALAAAMLIGSAIESGAHDRNDVTRAAGKISALLASGETDHAITLAEQTLSAHPQDAALRGVLGQAYLHAGRFASAASALGDAISLGDQSGRTALGLALAQIAIGQTHDAIATLDRSRDAIPAGDIGLALALAGDSARGVSVLTDAVRGGGASAKLRQNLAYAYALDGRWTEARLTAAMDVPADQIDSRLEQWAMSMRTGAEHQRIATLLGVSVLTDGGMPSALALNPQSDLPALATAPAPAVTPAGSHAELPALAAAAAADPVPVAAAAPSPEARPAITYVSNPVVQALPQPKLAANAGPNAGANDKAVVGAVVGGKAGLSGDATASGDKHFVQLGAFSSSRHAQRAVGYFLTHHPQLSGHQFVVTSARVHGHMYWRVAAAGFDASGANGLCTSVRHSGGACFAYASRAGSQPHELAVSHGPSLAARR